MILHSNPYVSEVQQPRVQAARAAGPSAAYRAAVRLAAASWPVPIGAVAGVVDRSTIRSLA
jgi:hypothetical protein